MGGLWTLECPNEGVFQGDCKVTEKGKGFTLKCPRGLVRFKSPKTLTCESNGAKDSSGNPHKFLLSSLTKCEKKHKSVQKLLSRCIKALEKRKGIRSPVAVCRASIKCPP